MRLGMRCCCFAFILSGCSGSPANEADDGSESSGDASEGGDGRFEDAAESPDAADESGADSVVDAVEDAGIEGSDWGEVDWIDGSVPDLPYVAQCGNGVLDDGEECDDGDRLNGDGCDWLCREGDGDPPPDPDPGVADYAPIGDPATLEDIDFPGTTRLTLAWSGTHFATAACEDLTPGDGGDSAWRFRFRRFDRLGHRLDADWTYPGPAEFSDVDLVWNGRGYGLFYDDAGWGIVFLELDEDGKPIRDPMLVEADSRVLAFAADWTGEAYVLSWTSEGAGGDSHCAIGAPNPVRVALIGADGTTAGRPGPVVVEASAGWNVDVAAGNDGLGLTMDVLDESLGSARCVTRFLRVSADLTEVVPSGILADRGSSLDVRWADGGYLTAWPNGTEDASGNLDEVCVARFGADGTLAGAPVCTRLSGFGLGGTRDARLAAGDGGAALLFTAHGVPGRLLFLRTDLRGTPVGLPHDVFSADPDEPEWRGHYTATWSGDGFGVLFSGPVASMMFRAFAMAE